MSDTGADEGPGGTKRKFEEKTLERKGRWKGALKLKWKWEKNTKTKRKTEEKPLKRERKWKKSL